MAKYVALSDIHLGQNKADKIRGGQFCTLSQISTEFADAHRTAEHTLAKLADRVNAFAGADDVTMVVAGDMLDLSLAYVRESLIDLVGLLRRLERVTELVYVIGNHDHHIWCLHSEWERSIGRLQRGELPQSGGMYRSTSRTGERHHMLSELCTKQLGRPVQITCAYPSYAFEHDNAGKRTRFYFTHGHLFGGLYTTLSDILADKLEQFAPEEVAATVNAPIIELVYWSLAQAGDGLGADGLMEQIYADLQEGRNSEVRDLVGRAVDRLIPDGIITGVPDRLEQWLLVAAVMHVIKKSEATSPGSVSTDRHAEVATTREQLQRWVNRIGMDTATTTHFVYGHTHVADEWKVPDTEIHTYNMGSWLIEPNKPAPQQQLLFIDAAAGRLGVDLESL